MIGFLRRRKRSQEDEVYYDWEGRKVNNPSDYGDDYRDFVCPYCDYEWRYYGNGGLVLGMWPDCPKCGTPAEEA